MSRSLIVAALLCFLASPGFAQDGRKVVHAGRMIDVISGKTLADRAIWTTRATDHADTLQSQADRLRARIEALAAAQRSDGAAEATFSARALDKS